MLFQGQQRTCVAICTPIPCHDVGGRLVHDTISPLWHRHRMGMATPTNFNSVEMVADGLEVGDARSKIARRCLDHRPRPEFLLFLDYDVLMPTDTLTKLFFRARTRPHHDVYCGVYCLKRPGLPEPLIYGEHGQGPLWDWAVGDILTTASHGVCSVHMGLTLIRVDIFQRILDLGLATGDGTDQAGTPFFKTTDRAPSARNGAVITVQGTEDIWFCDLLIKAGGSILVDTSVLAGHHDKSTGVTYGIPYLKGSPTDRARWLPDGQGGTADRAEADAADPPLKLALDLGSGPALRKWDGHTTYRLDARPEVKPDYCQDLLLLNLPDNHFDLVASSHAFEHVGRWDQERLWAEAYRVCRPGGVCEVIVPNAEWAAAKIHDGVVDGHVLNVLYGAQEAHGYAREFNTHYFCYTPAIIRALAAQAGFTDLVVEDWKSHPDLTYHLVLRGHKPHTGGDPPHHPDAESQQRNGVATPVAAAV